MMSIMGISTEHTLHTHRGIPVETVRCEACGSHATCCWEVTRRDGAAAAHMVAKYLATHDKGPTISALRQ